jgi:hypothetical protein
MGIVGTTLPAAFQAAPQRLLSSSLTAKESRQIVVGLKDCPDCSVGVWGFFGCRGGPSGK